MEIQMWEGAACRRAEAVLRRLYEDGRERAGLGLLGHGETEAAGKLPAECPYTLDDMLRRGWYPDPPGGEP